VSSAEFKSGLEKSHMVRIEGNLDMNHVEWLLSFRSDVVDCLKTHTGCHYILDLTNVNNVDSTGIGILVYLKEEIENNGGSVELVNMNERVAGFFRMTTMDEYFNIA